jgi:hypothetical protein
MLRARSYDCTFIFITPADLLCALILIERALAEGALIGGINKKRNACLSDRTPHRPYGVGDASTMVGGRRRPEALKRPGQVVETTHARPRRNFLGSYGGKVGAWRITNPLSQDTARATLCPNAGCAEILPAAAHTELSSVRDCRPNIT